MAPKPQRDEFHSPHQVTNSKSGESEECFTPLKAKAGSGGKMSSNGKIFSEDDVVCLLKRLADFWASGKSNKWVEFHRFVKDDLSKEYTHRQVSEKIRSLNDKFHYARVKPSDPHEATVYMLSKLLWEDELNDQNKKRKPKKKRKTNTNETTLAFHESYNKTNEDDQANTILASGESYKKIKHNKKRKKTNEDEANTILSIAESYNKTDEGDHANTILATGESYKKIKRNKKRKTNEDEANTILATGESYKKIKHNKKTKTNEDEANTIPAIGEGEREDEIGLDEFECEYPYLCASFKMPGCPKLSIKERASIGRKCAQELEDEWRELKAQQLRFELKKLTHPGDS
ncbi:uncharacterized protein LOC121751540 [Salvia splendens]|uniref:uncharacterized protein LOC121751526 n=1 Tax=Salvia splendens TaxID=180675 RepID=UPI001C269745|nr:uncharacterized protein LOC121751526 [Salvia splendens]XP_042002229.1 uncharacterized protein LOC121751540 [Salvia splendens]